jgi:cytochrome c-type protein NapC
MIGLIRRYWTVISRPSRYFSLGFLTLGGFIGGIVFWGGFNTAMEATNTEAFCTGCHEMRDHVPHDWTDKIARKMQASKEVWGKVFGTIDTPEKFRAMRLELARHEWARFKANDSLECRNCHQYESRDFTRQSVRAQAMHSTYLASKEKTCIDCHKGIAHRLPHIPPGLAPSDTPGQAVPRGEVVEVVAPGASAPAK